MFGVDSSELLLVALVALLVIGPKDLPNVLRQLGVWVGKARGIAAQFRSGFDDMIRQSELEELERKWKAENERIMQAHPPTREYDSVPPPEADDAQQTFAPPSDVVPSKREPLP